jgi:S1-C subfamily serine protease
VAVIGFPGGVDSPQLETAEGTFATTTLTAGTVSKNLPNLIQINGYGAQGASGSPIFDASGMVIAILYGGVPGSGGRVVYAVPSSYAVKLLDSIN